MIATARWGRKKPHAARLPAFDELVIPHLIHVEDMGGSICVIAGDEGSRIHLSVTRRAGKTSVIVVEEEGRTPMNQDPRSRILRLVDTVTLRASDLAAFPDSDALLTALADMIARGEIKRTGDILTRPA